MTDINTLVKLANNSYNLVATNSVGTYVPTASAPTLNTATGFTGRAHFSNSDNTLVITFTGTNDELDYNSNSGISGFITDRSRPEQLYDAVSVIR